MQSKMYEAIKATVTKECAYATFFVQRSLLILNSIVHAHKKIILQLLEQ